MQAMTFRNKGCLLFVVIAICLMFSSSHALTYDDDQEPTFLDCTHISTCVCGQPIAVANQCLCPKCPNPVPEDVEQLLRVIHHPKTPSDQHQLPNLQNGEELSPVTNVNELKNIYQATDDDAPIDCSKVCPYYGGKRIEMEHSNPTEESSCQCYCGPGEMTRERQSTLPCESFCHNRYFLEIERNEYKCQHRCICSKNIALWKEFEKFNLDEQVKEDNCRFLEYSIKKMDQNECDTQCGKYIGGQLVPYNVILNGEIKACSNTNYCKCNSKLETSNIDQNQSQCQKECNFNVSHVEYSLTNSFTCHCKN